MYFLYRILSLSLQGSLRYGHYPALATILILAPLQATAVPLDALCIPGQP